MKAILSTDLFLEATKEGQILKLKGCKFQYGMQLMHANYFVWKFQGKFDEIFYAHSNYFQSN